MSEVGGNLIAILGPTNTGKTYLAFERLLSYEKPPPRKYTKQKKSKKDLKKMSSESKYINSNYEDFFEKSLQKTDPDLFKAIN